MSRIYFAAPLFCVGEKDWNAKVTAILEQAGHQVFLPQRDGILAAELENKTAEEKVNIVFARDYGELQKCDVLVFVLDGRVPDEGACVELGIAYAAGKPCYGIRTDARALEDGMPINPLVAGCFRKIFDSPDPETLLTDLQAFAPGI